MINVVQILKEKFPNIKGKLYDISGGLCPLDYEALNLDILKRQNENGEIRADNISTPDTVGVFKGRTVFIEFKSLKENQLVNKEKRLSLFLKQVDILVLLYFLEETFRNIILKGTSEFWLVYGKESFKRAIKSHFEAYGIDKRYGFIYRKIRPISKDNFIELLNNGNLKL